MLEIDLVVNVLKDGEWHELNEVFNRCKHPKVKAENILEFLVEHGFIGIDGVGWKVKVSPSFQKFLEEAQL